MPHFSLFAGRMFKCPILFTHLSIIAVIHPLLRTLAFLRIYYIALALKKHERRASETEMAIPIEAFFKARNLIRYN